MKRYIICKVVLILIFLQTSVFANSYNGFDTIYEQALDYRYILSLKGFDYMPWQDRISNDIILMEKLLSLGDYGENRFKNYQIVSTSSETYVNSSKNMIFLNYLTPVSDLKSFFYYNSYIDNVSKVKIIRKKKAKILLKQKRSKRKYGGVVEVVQGRNVKYVEKKPVKVRHPFAISNKIVPQKVKG